MSKRVLYQTPSRSIVIFVDSAGSKNSKTTAHPHCDKGESDNLSSIEEGSTKNVNQKKKKFRVKESTEKPSCKHLTLVKETLEVSKKRKAKPNVAIEPIVVIKSVTAEKTKGRRNSPLEPDTEGLLINAEDNGEWKKEGESSKNDENEEVESIKNESTISSITHVKEGDSEKEIKSISNDAYPEKSVDNIAMYHDTNAEGTITDVISTQETLVKTKMQDRIKFSEFFDVPVYIKPLEEQRNRDTYQSYPSKKPEPKKGKSEVQMRLEKDLMNNDVTLNAHFLRNFSTILESPSFTSRKKQFDELLKLLSSVSLKSDIIKPKNKLCFWGAFRKRKKSNEKSSASLGEPINFFTNVYPNYSFYHYNVKSNIEGLNFEPNKNYKYGEKGSGFQAKGEPQDFYKLRDGCLQNGTLFEDPEFPPTDSSLFFSHRPDRHFEWKRPSEIADNPQFFVEGFSRFDVQQGELGDCWLLAAVANLTLYRRLFFQIVPDDQSFDEDYAGIFHFRFWQYGRWIDVVIDDRLPTYRGDLVFLHSTEENEFWSALLEKAYAKLYGSYEALKGGSTCEAMEDFTGGVTEMYEMNASPPNLFQIILKAYERWSLMGCSIEPDPNVLEAQTAEGLIRGHAYSITKVQYVSITTPRVSGKIPLLRLRNPWGNESEWTGPWSDHSHEWQYISDFEKEELGLNFDTDGEFWMSFKDFQTFFSRLEICNLNPDSLSEHELTEGRNKKWVMSVFEGEWVRGVTAGGCRNFLDTFWHNPQYRVTLEEVDEGDDEDKCTMIVALMQKNRRQLRQGGGDLLTIGFAIYYLPQPDRVPKPLDLNFFKYNASVARSPSFINLREVSCRFKLPPGTYCIVPSTFDPNDEGEFLLRVFSEHQNNMEENDQLVGISENQVMKHQDNPTPDSDETATIQKQFNKIAGRDNEIDWKELQEILNYYTKRENNKGFSKDVCRSMIAMLDTDRTGKLNFEEFQRLFLIIKNWKNVFKKFDKYDNGTLESFELRSALNSVGYSLNARILNVLMQRYGTKGNKIEFDDFIMCAVKLKMMMDLFNEKAEMGQNTATFTLEQWIEFTLSS